MSIGENVVHSKRHSSLIWGRQCSAVRREEMTKNRVAVDGDGLPREKNDVSRCYLMRIRADCCTLSVMNSGRGRSRR